MATAVKEKDMHGNELVISGAPYPISNPSILDRGGAAAQQSAAAIIITSSTSSSSPPSPLSSKADVESHIDLAGQTKAHGQQQAGVTPALSNLAGYQSGPPSSIINKHHNCCNTASNGDDAVISQQQQQQEEEEPLLQPQPAAGNTCSETLPIRIPPSSSFFASRDAQRVQVSCVSNCQSEEQACHSGGHDLGPGPLISRRQAEQQLCLLQHQHPQQSASHTEHQIIPPQNAQARLTPHKQQELPTPAPPSYINSTAPSQLLGSPQKGTTGGKSQEAEEGAGGDFTQAQEQPRQQSHHSTSGAPPTNMIFSDLYKSPRSPFNKLRHSIPSVTLPATDLEADLISRDKTRQKEAVKKFLNEKIRDDWDFTWPPTPAPAPAHVDDRLEEGSSRPAAQDGEETSGGSSSSVPTAASPTFDEDAPRDPGEEADSESDAESVYSTVSEDQSHFHPRIEWTSDISDDDLPTAHASSPFRFDTPDAVGTAVQTSINERKTRRRRAVRDEISWNPGLACFEARRDAWTGAKTVRVKPKPATPISPSSTRRLSFWRHHRSESTTSQNTPALSPGSPPISSPLSPTATHTSNLAQTATASEPDSSNASKIHSTSSRDSAAHAPYPVETLIPVAPPLLPPQNPMRASVTPSIYPSLYDKIVVHSLQPSCPVNLGDMLRACVVGWKRDGEWPPKSTIQAVPMSAAAEAMVLRHQRRASQAQAKHTRKASTATNGSSRRLSFVGFLGGGNKNAGVEKEKPATIHQGHEAKEGPATAANGGKDTHSDEANSGGGTGKGIRRSLQKVFSLGQHGHHGHAHTQSSAAPAEAAISPPKEVAAAL